MCTCYCHLWRCWSPWPSLCQSHLLSVMAENLHPSVLLQVLKGKSKSSLEWIPPRYCSSYGTDLGSLFYFIIWSSLLKPAREHVNIYTAKFKCWVHMLWVWTWSSMHASRKNCEWKNSESLSGRLVHLPFVFASLEYFCWSQSILHVSNISYTSSHIPNSMSS